MYIVSVNMRSNLLGGAGSAGGGRRSNGGGGGGGANGSNNLPSTVTTNADLTVTNPRDPKPKKQKTTSQAADALLSKAAVKISQGDGLENLLRRSGVHLGLQCFSGAWWLSCLGLGLGPFPNLSSQTYPTASEGGSDG